MFGALVRLVVILVVLAAGVHSLWNTGLPIAARPVRPRNLRSCTPNAHPVDTSKARDTGAAVGEKVAVGANEAQHAIGSAALTGKIKAKMALTRPSRRPRSMSRTTTA